MSNLLRSLPIAAIICASLPAAAETRIETVLGTVTEVSPLTSSIVRETPKTERICTEEDVPIYSQNSGGDSELGSLIVGGLIGSAIGNKLSDKDGAGAAGAVAGALLGREQAKKNNKGSIVGYKQQTVCQDKQILVTETVQRVTGYRLKIEADDRILSIDVSDDYSVGQRVELRKEVSYSVR